MTTLLFYSYFIFFLFLVVHTTAIGKPTVAQIPNGNYVFFINFSINYINNDYHYDIYF